MTDPEKPDVEKLHSPEGSAPELLRGSLGIEMTPELVEIVSALTAALVDVDCDPDTLRRLWTEYALQFEALANRATDAEMRVKVQIAAILHKAFIFRDTGKELRYLEELTKGEVYAASAGFETLSVVLATEIDTKTAELEPGPERLILQLRGKINDANLIQLWDLWVEEQDYEDLVNHAYEMLLGEGEDPEAVLGELGVLES